MLTEILAKAEKATVWVGRYCNLDRAARWHRPALVIGTIGWAGRWAIVALLGVELFGGFSAEAEAAAALEPAAGGDSFQKTALYTAAILGCMVLKWAGWTYGGVGYVHHRAQSKPQTKSLSL